MKPHRFEPLSFLFGAMALALAVNVLLASDDGRAIDSARFWPTVALITGISLIGWVVAGTVRHGRDAKETKERSSPDVEPDPGLDPSPDQDVAPDD